MTTEDPFDLQRFITAQGPVYTRVCAELEAGRKASHWMWFIFPQIAGLGRSATAERYAISGLAEAKAYLAHPVLGPRLAECTRLVLGIEGRTADTIFGYPDTLKFHSSMTLFSAASEGADLFDTALKNYFGHPDAMTLDLLERSAAKGR